MRIPAARYWPDGKLPVGPEYAARRIDLAALHARFAAKVAEHRRVMANARGIDMPIASAVAAVLDGSLTVDAAIESLLTRPFKAEG